MLPPEEKGQEAIALGFADDTWLVAAADWALIHSAAFWKTARLADRQFASSQGPPRLATSHVLSI